MNIHLEDGQRVNVVAF